MGRDEAGPLSRLMAHRRELVDPKVHERRGRIVKTTGDGMLVGFPSVVDAVRCAVEVQQGMAERNARIPPEQRIDLRVGINLGDVMVQGDDIFGDGVNGTCRRRTHQSPAARRRWPLRERAPFAGRRIHRGAEDP